MLKKLKSKLKTFHEENISILARHVTKSGMRKMLVQDVMSKHDDINKYFDQFSGNYVKILEYLRDDFKNKKITSVNLEGKKETDIIDDEIEDYKYAISRRINKTLLSKFRKFKKFNKYDIANNLTKWYFLRLQLHYYPQALTKLENLAKTKVYKDIDFEKENDDVKFADYLKQDFSLFTKKINKNGILGKLARG